MSVDIDLFPSKLALGEQFCNRVSERQVLQRNIEKSRPTVLVSPRRYGKSSLAHHVMSGLQHPYAAVDFFLAYDERTIMHRLLSGIAQLIAQALTPGEKTLNKVQSFFSQFKVSLGVGVFNIELVREAGDLDAVDQIYQALTACAQLLKKENKKAIIFIDEFQDIAVAKNSKAIQGAIRNIAQSSNELVFIFSGSNRHLLLEMFDDKSMPLYMLCDKLCLERMSSLDYHSHLQKCANYTWQQVLPDRVFSRIMSLTELHPFYVNLLCHLLWQGNFPDESKVDAIWHQCMENESRRIRAELEKLTRKQQDFLKALALHPTIEPTGQEFSMRSGIAASSLYQITQTLFLQDIIFKVQKLDTCIPFWIEKQVRILDPLMAYYLRQYA